MAQEVKAGHSGSEGESGEEGSFSPEEIAAFCLRDEQAALAAVFDDVRALSGRSQLSEPSHWADAGLVPGHLTPDEFEMYVYDYLAEFAAQQTAEGEWAEEARPVAPVIRTATRAVGIPQAFGTGAAVTEEAAGAGAGAAGAPAGDGEAAAEERAAGKEQPGAAGAVGEGPGGEPPAAEAGEAAVAAAEEAEAAAAEEESYDLPEGYELVELEGELALVPIEGYEPKIRIDCSAIAVLTGARSYYLYSRDFMTDTYAHWAFLAREDDRIATFVECVREESRLYPRPMAASSLENPPFKMGREEIGDIWHAVCESGDYPDIETTAASNGDVYYYSTRHLSPAYAASLAEWEAVEREMNR